MKNILKLHYSFNNQLVYINSESIVSIEERPIENDTFVSTANTNYCVKETILEILNLLFPRTYKNRI